MACDLATHPKATTFMHEAAHAVVGMIHGIKCDCIRLKEIDLGNELKQAGAAALGPAVRKVTALDWAAADYAGYTIQRVMGQSHSEAALGADEDARSIRRHLMSLGLTEGQAIEEGKRLFEVGVKTCQHDLMQPGVKPAIEALAQVLCNAYDAGAEYVRAEAIYPTVKRHLKIDPALEVLPSDDPCAD